MAFEAVDACFGTPHISSDDLAALNTAAIGKADCVLHYGDDFKAVMSSANECLIGTGVGMVGGRRFWNQAATSLTIQSGTQGQKRNDLVVARYEKTSAGIESITPVVIKGTPTTGTPDDPEVTANDLKLWRVPLDGINAGTPVRLFEPVTPLATLGESVSHEVGFQFLYGTGFSDDFVAYRKKGFSVEMIWNFQQESTKLWRAGTLPVGFRPAHGFQEPSVLANVNSYVTNNIAAVNVTGAGQVSFMCTSSVTGGRNIGHSVWIAA